MICTSLTGCPVKMVHIIAAAVFSLKNQIKKYRLLFCFWYIFFSFGNDVIENIKQMKVGYEMKNYKAKNRKKNAQKASVIVAVVLCAVSMVSIAMIYRSAVKKQQNVKSLIETEDAGESDLAELEEEDNIDLQFTEGVDARITEEELEVEEAGVVDATRRDEMAEEVYIEEAVPEVANHFTEQSNLTWPVQGEVLMEYSMESPVYFKTLEQYGYSQGLVIQAERGQPVYASADGTVKSVSYTDEYGWTVTVDLGDGYEATYGQLADITVSEGDNIVTGAVIAEVAVPSKFYSLEGDNLYFSLKQNENTVDPLDYLE